MNFELFSNDSKFNVCSNEFEIVELGFGLNGNCFSKDSNEILIVFSKDSNEIEIVLLMIRIRSKLF